MMSAVAKAGFRPLHDAHAIEAVVVNVQFNGPIPDGAFAQAIGVLGSFAQKLPGANEMRGPSMQFGGPQIIFGNHQVQSALPDGISRFRTDARGVQIEELRLDRNSLLYGTQDYAGWDQFITDAIQYISPILGPIQEICTPQVFQGFSLTYIDKFFFYGEEEDFDSSLLLRPDSKYLARFIESSNDLWHCHVGRFVKEEPGVKRLKSIRLDCVDDNSQVNNFSAARKTRFVRIESTISDIFDIAESSDAQLCFSRTVLERYQNLHVQQKEIFSEILNDVILRKIGM